MSWKWLWILLLAVPALASSPVDIAILSPSPLEAVFGQVRLVADVSAAEGVERVEFYVDGRFVGEVGQAPYELLVDVGTENLEHEFRVLAIDTGGNRGEATIVTPKVRVDLRVEVELQQLYVTVMHDTKRALDLEAPDFEVLDDHQAQQLVTFARGNIPLTAALVLDSSASMEGKKLEAALAGARAFVEGMEELDEAAVFLFSDRLLRSTPFTPEPQELLASLGGVHAHGNTALNDHLYLALKLLDGRQGRRVVVVLSDGLDLHSVLGMEDVLWKARRSQALIYWLRVDENGGGLGDFTTAWRDVGSNRRELELLEQTVRESGGRIVPLGSVDEIPRAFGDILQELRQQYVLGYYPTESRNDGSWHTVKVRVKKPGYRVRAREGYIDL